VRISYARKPEVRRLLATTFAHPTIVAIAEEPAEPRESTVSDSETDAKGDRTPTGAVAIFLATSLWEINPQSLGKVPALPSYIW
jgi:hypothetical protein